MKRIKKETTVWFGWGAIINVYTGQAILGTGRELTVVFGHGVNGNRWCDQVWRFASFGSRTQIVKQDLDDEQAALEWVYQHPDKQVTDDDMYYALGRLLRDDRISQEMYDRVTRDRMMNSISGYVPEDNR